MARERGQRRGGRRRGGTTKAKAKSQDGLRRRLSERPADEPVQARTFDLTKRSGLAGIGAAVGGAAWAVVTALQKQPPEVIIAGLAVLAAAIIGYAIIASSDLLARARVTAAEFAASRSSAEEEEEDENGLPATLESVTPVGPEVTVSVGSQGDLRVLAIAWDPVEDELEYLAGRPGDRPDWIRQSDVTGVRYGRSRHGAVGEPSQPAAATPDGAGQQEAQDPQAT